MFFRVWAAVHACALIVITAPHWSCGCDYTYIHLAIHPSLVVGRTWWGVLLWPGFQWGLLRWGPLGFVVVGPGMLCTCSGVALALAALGVGWPLSLSGSASGWGVAPRYSPLSWWRHLTLHWELAAYLTGLGWWFVGHCHFLTMPILTHTHTPTHTRTHRSVRNDCAVAAAVSFFFLMFIFRCFAVVLLFIFIFVTW